MAAPVRKLDLYTVDAFTDRPFAGNPAAVCLLNYDTNLADPLLQNIAMEMNLSETAYIRTLSSGDDHTTGRRFGLRWFTPVHEVKLCGHATLASAAALFYQLGNQSEEITFETLSGDLTVKRDGDHLVMDFPLGLTVEKTAEEYAAVIQALGDIPGVQDVRWCPSLKYLLIRLKDGWNRSEFEKWRLDVDQLEKAVTGVTVVIATTRGSSQQGYVDEEGIAYDFVSRCYAPWSGIPEDPVTDLQDFQQLTGQVFIYGSVSLALAMAHETGMIKILCQAEGPLSSTDIANKGKLKERYVRELLNALTVGGLVQLASGTGGRNEPEALYTVPGPHRDALTAAGMYARAISHVARQFAAVRECFDLEGPSCIRLNANSFDFFDECGTLHMDKVIDAILKTPGLKQRFEEGMEAAEVGCGLARLTRRLAAMFPKTQFTVTDVVPEPLERARQIAQSEGLANLNFQLLNVCKVPDEWKDKFDWLVALDVIHDLPQPLEGLRGISKVLKSGGQFSLVDAFLSSYVAENLSSKEAAALHVFGTFVCIPESYQQPNSEALGPCWGEEKARQLLQAAGFKVLGLTKTGTESVASLAVCMCQKQE